MTDKIYEIGEKIHFKDSYVEGFGVIKDLDDEGMGESWTIYDVEITKVIEGEADPVNIEKGLYAVRHVEVIGEIK